MIALNHPVSGALRGVRGADYQCHSQARRHGLRGTYRAFLSSSTQDLASIVYYSRDRQIPIVNKNVCISIQFQSLRMLLVVTDPKLTYFISQKDA